MRDNPSLTQEKWYMLIKAALDYNAYIVGSAALMVQAGEQKKSSLDRNVRLIQKETEKYANQIKSILDMNNEQG